MSDLGEMMEAALGGTASPDRALEQTMSRVRRRRRLRTMATAATALLLSTAAIGFVWSGFFGGADRADTAATPSAGAVAVEPVVVADVSVGAFPSTITIGEGDVWVAVESRSAGGNVIARIDPATNEVIRSIPVSGSPGSLTIEAGSLWIGLPGSVQRLDTTTGRIIANIAGPGTSVTRTPGAVWALDSANSIARIDPATNQVVAAVTLDLPASGYIISSPVGSTDAVWVMAFMGDEVNSERGNGLLLRIDPSTNAVVAKIDLKIAGAFAVGDGAVWVVSDYSADRTTLTRVDAASEHVGTVVDVEGGWTPFAVGAGRVWLMGGVQPEIRVAGLNVSTLALEKAVVVGELPADEGSGVYDPGTASLWIAQYEDSITRVELRSTTSEARMSTPS